VEEYAPDAAFAARYPRAERYVGWPMLVVLDLRAAAITIPETQSGKAAARHDIARDPVQRL